MPKLTRKPLGQKAIAAAKPRPEGDYTLWDSSPRGFGLRVFPTGRKVFVIQYRNAQGRIRRMNLGEYGRLTVDEARTLAKPLLAEVDKGAIRSRSAIGTERGRPSRSSPRSTWSGISSRRASRGRSRSSAG